MATATQTRYFVRRPCDYGRLGTLDRGQVISLLGARNDETLVRLAYFAEYTGETAVCSVCGAEFVGEPERTAHGNKRHSERDRDLSPAEEDARLEREERMLEQTAPLNLENTKASRAESVPLSRRIRTPE